MLDKVKNALRVKTAAFDDEIQDLIDACKADLRLVGVNVPEDTPAEGKEVAFVPSCVRSLSSRQTSPGFKIRGFPSSSRCISPCRIKYKICSPALRFLWT